MGSTRLCKHVNRVSHDLDLAERGLTMSPLRPEAISLVLDAARATMIHVARKHRKRGSLLARLAHLQSLTRDTARDSGPRLARCRPSNDLDLTEREPWGRVTSLSPRSLGAGSAPDRASG